MTRPEEASNSDNPYASPAPTEDESNGPWAQVLCEPEVFEKIINFARSQGLILPDEVIGVAFGDKSKVKTRVKRSSYVKDRVALVGCGLLSFVAFFLIILGILFAIRIIR